MLSVTCSRYRYTVAPVSRHCRSTSERTVICQPTRRRAAVPKAKRDLPPLAGCAASGGGPIMAADQAGNAKRVGDSYGTPRVEFND